MKNNQLYFDGKFYDINKFKSMEPVAMIVAYNLTMLQQVPNSLKECRDYKCRMSQAIQTFGPEAIAHSINSLIETHYVP